MWHNLLRKLAKKILVESRPNVYVEIAQINYGGILKDMSVVVTGGGHGLGYYMAKKCISEGANVIIAGRNKDVLENSCKKLGGKCQYIVHDISEVEKCSCFLKQCKDLFGNPIDCFISNAGIALHESSFQEVTIQGFDEQFDTNLRANYFLAKAYIEMKLLEETSGNLLLISSLTGNQCYDLPYGLTKTAINSLTGALSRRVYGRGIRVNAVAPGVTMSDMTKKYAQPSNGDFGRNCPSKRIFLPEEVAELVCFLLSKASMCISGEVIHCDAGEHLSCPLGEI